MLFIKIQSSVFALAVATMMLIASSSTTTSVVSAIGNTSGGGIRGATSKDADSAQVRFNNNNQGHQRRRHLQMEDKNDVPVDVVVVATVASPTLPPAPVAPPTPTGVNEWTSRCAIETRQLNNCVPSSGNQREGCRNCLYASSFTSGNSIAGCRSFCTSDCDVFANAFYKCGAMIMDPTSAPIVPVSTPTDPPIAPVDPISLSFTQTGCPASGASGEACTVPSPFLYQECFYGGNMRCTCRSDPGSLFLCNPDNSASAPAPQPVTQPTIAGVTPFPVVQDSGSTTCSSSLPKSGDVCELPDDQTTNIQCCYSVDIKNGNPAPANYAWICSCSSFENVYLCNEGTTASCTSVIRPSAPALAPVELPVPAPTEIPILPTDPAPTDMPITSTEPAPTDMPILVGATAPPVSTEMGGTGCPARLSDFTDGSSCAGSVPDEKASIGCGYEVIVGSPPLSSEAIICECVKANPLWACRSLGLTPIASPNECPSQDSPPANGDSCAGLLVTEDSAQTCMFSRKLSSSSELETFNCTCSNAAGSTVDLWSCDGSFMPVVAPSLMPAGQVQPSTTIPVPTAPTTPTTTTPMVCGTFPGDGTTCAGVLPVGLSSASCNYSQTITTNGVPLDETATCECDASTEIWNCVGSFTPAPPNAVPVVPTMMPILSGVPEPTEMPILSGVPEPTEMPILSGAPEPTEMPILSGVPEPTEMPILSGVPEPTGTTPPAPTDGLIAIPNSVDFSSGSDLCPAKITNCEPCAQYFPNSIEGSCTQFTQIPYEGAPTTFKIQCRCPEQEIDTPTWSCRFIGGTENSITFPASPICAPEDFTDP